MNPFRRLFGKPAAPRIVDRREMNEDWKVGDLAECVNDKWRPGLPHAPRRGDVLRVIQVREARAYGTGDLIIGLVFEGKPANHGWDCVCFRKLRPVHEACEEEFAALVKRDRRTPVLNPARHRRGEPA